MSKATVIPALDDLRERLHNLMLGFAQHTSRGMTSLAEPADWRSVADAELRRRSTRLVDAFDDELLAAIASGAVNPCFEASFLAQKLREAEADDADAAQVVGAPSEQPQMPASIQAMRATVDALALKHLGFTTLEPPNRDSLDFREVAAWCVREALSEAFYEGARRGIAPAQPEAMQATTLAAKRDRLRDTVAVPSAEDWLLVGYNHPLVAELNELLCIALDALKAGELQGRVRHHLFERLVQVHEANTAAGILDSEGMATIATFFAVNYDPALYDFIRYYNPFGR